MRARIVLAAGAGESNSAIARRLAVSRPTVIMWRQRFAAGGAGGAHRGAARPWPQGHNPGAKVKAIIAATTQTTPPGQTH